MLHSLKEYEDPMTVILRLFYIVVIKDGGHSAIINKCLDNVLGNTEVLRHEKLKNV